jgi:alpha-ketoglutarate-dependent taurine dioxygenase
MSKDGRSYFWHTDQQFKAIPSMGSLLHAKVGYMQDLMFLI